MSVENKRRSARLSTTDATPVKKMLAIKAAPVKVSKLLKERKIKVVRQLTGLESSEEECPQEDDRRFKQNKM